LWDLLGVQLIKELQGCGRGVGEVWESTEIALMLETGGQVQVLAGARRCKEVQK